MVTKGVWWLWEVVTKGVWWLWEVVTKGVWWLWEVVTKGVWWLWKVVNLGSGDEGKWWRREVVIKGSGEEGKVTNGSGDKGNAAECIVMAAWTLHGACVGEEAGARNLVFFIVFPCGVVAAGNERYLLSAAVAAAVGLLFFCRTVTVASSCFGCACAYVVIACFGICGCRSQWNGYMIVATFCCHVCRDMRVRHEIGSSSVFFNQWLFLCA